MNNKFTDFYESWHFLENHEMFQDKNYYFDCKDFPHVLSINVIKVNPKTKEVSDIESENTKVEIWLETGPYIYDEHSDGSYIPCHDIDLDCGGDTFEQAIIELAKLVDKFYDENTGEKKCQIPTI